MNEPRIKELREVPLPERLKNLPRDERGYIIPFFVPIINGKPDMKLLDEAKQIACIKQELCAICGTPVGWWKVFVVGPLGVQNRVSHDPACHEECARYAAQVCPYLVRPNAQRAKTYTEGAHDAPGQVLERPDKMALYVTNRYTPIVVRQPGKSASVLLKLGAPRRIEWWRNGQQIEESD